ncbi:neuronal PAS domain-containing protein 4-like isoform X2 [Lethenteron reissneri]|nr:neuronal PAS domain-containing protein 4-like isoform X2 [Lethenteron reissneri]
MARSPPDALTVPTAVQAQPGGGNSPRQSEPPPVRQHHHQHHQQQQQPRSTKGASKARRDLINAEIRRIRELLPLSDADKARLSYLHVMALACVYTRRGLAFPAGCSAEGSRRVGGGDGGEDSTWGEVAAGWSHSLPGFVLVMTREARLVYLSDNVSDVLGYSMVDLVAQGDSFYDIVDEEDRAQVQSKLQGHGECTEVSFVCRVSTARALRRQGSNRALAVRSRAAPAPPGCAWQQQQRRQLLWLLCCPAEDVNAAGSQLRSRLAAASSSSSPHGHQQQQLQPQLQQQQRWQENGFASKHSRDMRWISAERSVVYHLEYEAQELTGKSWYQLLHPEDVGHATSQHSILVQSRDSCEVRMIVRLQRKSGDCSWVLATAQLQDDVIFCDNLMISEAEATNLRGAVGLAPRPVASGPFHGGFGPSADALEEPPIDPADVDAAAPLLEPLADALADTLVDALVDTLSETMAETLAETLAETMAEPLSVQLMGHQVEASSAVSTAASLLLMPSPVPHQTAAPCTAAAAPSSSSSSSSPPYVAEILRTLEVGLPGCRKRKRSEDIANPAQTAAHHPEMGLYCPPQPLQKLHRPQLHHHHHQQQQQQHQFQTPVWSERMLASAKHQPESSPGGLQCTPPYTPEKASTFLFNPCDVAARQQTFVPPSPSPGVYDQLPPTPDSPLTSAAASRRSLPPIGTFGGGRRAPGAPHAARGPHAYSEAEREHINVLARQISTLAETFDSYMRSGGGRGTQRQEGEELKASHTRLFLSGRSSSLPETRSGWLEAQADCSGELAGVGAGGSGGAPASLLLPPPPPCKRWRSLDFSIVPELEEGPSSSSVDREVVFDTLLKDIVDLQENEAAAVEEGVAGIMSAGGEDGGGGGRGGGGGGGGGEGLGEPCLVAEPQAAAASSPCFGLRASELYQLAEGSSPHHAPGGSPKERPF